MKARFAVGDKVRILDGSKIKDYTGTWCTSGMGAHIGEIATVESVDTDWTDDRVSYGLKEIGYCWDERGLKPTNNQHITIDVYGNKTVAKYGDKVGIARCSPEDKFDFETGAKIALERLFPKKFDWEKFKSGKIAVALNTREKYNKFMKICESKNIRWVSGNPAGGFYAFAMYEENTAVCCYGGDGMLEYATADFYKENGVEVIGFDSCMFEDNDDTIKVGDIVKIINTGKLYTTNDDWVLKHIENKALIAKYAIDDNLGYPAIKEPAEQFKVIAIAENKAYIQRSGHPYACYLIDLNGIEKL